MILFRTVWNKLNSSLHRNLQLPRRSVSLGDCCFVLSFRHSALLFGCVCVSVLDLFCNIELCVTDAILHTFPSIPSWWSNFISTFIEGCVGTYLHFIPGSVSQHNRVLVVDAPAPQFREEWTVCFVCGVIWWVDVHVHDFHCTARWVQEKRGGRRSSCGKIATAWARRR